MQDVVFGDEVGYLATGLQFELGRLPGFEYSSTFTDAYALLSLATSDPIGLYFAMRVVSALSFVLGFWVAARCLVGPALAWSGAALLGALPVTYVWPGVSGIAAGAVLVGAAVILRFRSVAGIAIAAAAFWFAAGSRPEFVWLAAATSALSVGWLLVAFAQRHSKRASRIRDLVAVGLGAIGVPLFLVALHGPPLGGGRSWVAFIQHYSLRVAGPGEDPWLDSTAIVARDFPKATSITEALAENPSAMMQHWIGNVGAVPNALLDQTLLDPSLSRGFRFVAVLMLVAVFAGFVMAFIARPHDARGKLLPIVGTLRQPRAWPSGALILLVMVAALIPVVLVFPRHHYLLVPIGLGLLALLVVQHFLGSPKYERLLPFAGTALAFALMSGLTLQAAINRVVYPAPTAKSLSLMRNSDVNWRVLSSDWGLQSGLGTFVPNSKVINVSDLLKEPDIDGVLEENGINAVWLTDDLAMQLEATFMGSKEFQEHPERFGFRKIHPESKLFVASDQGS